MRSSHVCRSMFGPIVCPNIWGRGGPVLLLLALCFLFSSVGCVPTPSDGKSSSPSHTEQPPEKTGEKNAPTQPDGQTGQPDTNASNQTPPDHKDGQTSIFDFSKMKPGGTIDGWIPSVTGSKKGTPPQWEIIEEDGKRMLAQLEMGGGRGDFPVCLKKDFSFRDGTASIRFRPISGKVDQAGGVVVRAADPDNFYVVRANALEDNVSFYVTQNGRRKTIKYWDNIRVAPGQWHDLTVDVRGNLFTITFDGKEVAQIADPNKTFSQAGMVGVWTKADSVTQFDHLSATPHDQTSGETP